MPLRLSAWKPEVVSVTRWRVSSETIRANQMIPIRRAERRPVRPAPLDEPRPRDDVRLAAPDRLEQLRQLGGIVLPVAVERAPPSGSRARART